CVRRPAGIYGLDSW
nr:immunoglobulin heavy chain junction region [Macaca mulatta]MOW91362.1 immunoglobulin heavy chain junction region [Macaca mulatta]